MWVVNKIGLAWTVFEIIWKEERKEQKIFPENWTLFFLKMRIIFPRILKNNLKQCATAASSFHQKNSFSKINNPWPWLPSWFFPKTWSHLPWLHTKIPPFFFLLLAIILFTKTFENNYNFFCNTKTNLVFGT